MPDNFTHTELNALALADAEIEMLASLVEMRRAKGMTQEHVAAAIGRDKSAVSRFERLDSDPRLSTVRRYARAVGALIEHRVTDFSSQPVTLRVVRAVDVAAEEDIDELHAVLYGADTNVDQDENAPLVGLAL